MSADEEGVLYLAFGYEYVVEAVLSLLSLRYHHPDLPASLLTNLAIAEDNPGGIFEGVEYFDEVITVDAENGENRHYKTSLVEYTPYERTLYLDADTYIENDITAGFAYVDAEFEMTVRPVEYPLGPDHHHFEDLEMNIRGLPLHEHSYYNTGVIFFDDSDETVEFFRAWNETYREIAHPYDAISFLQTTFETDVRIYPLNQTWNKNKQGHIDPRSLDRLRVYHYMEPHRNAEILAEIRRVEREIPDAFFPEASTHQLEAWRGSSWNSERRTSLLDRLLQWVSGR